LAVGELIFFMRFLSVVPEVMAARKMAVEPGGLQ
jgi:hypothetical protein